MTSPHGIYQEAPTLKQIGGWLWSGVSCAVIVTSIACGAPPDVALEDDWRTRFCDSRRPFGPHHAVEYRHLAVSDVITLLDAPEPRCQMAAAIFLGVVPDPASVQRRLNEVRGWLRAMGEAEPGDSDANRARISRHALLVKAAGFHERILEPEGEPLLTTLIDAVDPRWWVDFDTATAAQRDQAHVLARYALGGLAGVMHPRALARMEMLAAQAELPIDSQSRLGRLGGIVVQDALRRWRWRWAQQHPDQPVPSPSM